MKQIALKADDGVFVILVGNKCDLEKERQVSKEEGENFAKENKTRNC